MHRPRLKVVSKKDDPTGYSERKKKKKRQTEKWVADNIKEWTRIHFASSTSAAENGTTWKGVVAKSSVVPQRP